MASSFQASAVVAQTKDAAGAANRYETLNVSNNFKGPLRRQQCGGQKCNR
jgi:hypothetical protein